MNKRGGIFASLDSVVMPNKCKHIYGYDTGFADPSDIEYESAELIYFKEFQPDTKLDVKFNFCPMCGERFEA